MSTWSDPGNSLYWPETKPFVNAFAGSLGAGAQNETFEPSSYPNAVYTLLGIDTVCSGAEPSQITMAFWLGAAATQFYYDSQSTGEGLGVRFSWRGQLPVRAGYPAGITGNVISGPAVDWSGIFWGLVMPFAQAGT